MDKFLGNITDTIAIKNPFGSWQYSKNILLAKGFKSISNEDGISEEFTLPGTLIGSIISNTDEVYFTLNTTTGFSEIGHIDKRISNPVYTTILKDTRLGFRLDCPIEGIYNYNYKGDLIVMWGHGIRENSARPMILNINDLPFDTTSGVLDDPDDLELIYLFPNLMDADYLITRLEEGNFSGNVIYITYAYVYEDGSRTPFFPLSHYDHVTDGYENTIKYGINLKLNYLDSRFNKLVLGIIERDESSISGYISNTIEYTGSTFTTSIINSSNTTTLSYDTTISTGANEVGQSFTLAKETTIDNVDIFINSVEGVPNFLYRLNIYSITGSGFPNVLLYTSTNTLTISGFITSGFYNFTFTNAKLKAGQYAFLLTYENVILHNLSNRVLFNINSSDLYKGGELIKRKNGIWATFPNNDIFLKYTEKIDNGLDLDLLSTVSYTKTSADEIIISSEIFNKIKTITKTEDQVHIAGLNKQEIDDFQQYANQLVLEPTLRVSDRGAGVEHSFMPDEVYSFFIELELLDGTFTKGFHIPGRLPTGTETDVLTAQQITDFGLDWVDPNTKQFKYFNTGTASNISGSDYSASFGYWENEELYPNNTNYDSSSVGGTDLRNTPVRHHRFPDISKLYNVNSDLVALNYTLGLVNPSNFDLISQPNNRFILGVKLTNFDSIVPESIKNKIQSYRITCLKRNFSNSLVIDNCLVLKRKESTLPVPPTAENGHFRCVSMLTGAVQEFQLSRLFSTSLFNSKPSIKPTFLKANYAFTSYVVLGSPASQAIPDLNVFSEIDTLTYAPPNNLSYGNQYTEEGIDLNLVESQNFGLDVSKTAYGINGTLIQLKDNVYYGLNSSSDNLFIVGRTCNFDLPVEFNNGDVSVNCYFDFSVYEIASDGGGGFNSRQYVMRHAGYFTPLHTMSLYSESSYNIPVDSAREAELEGRDYDFSVSGKLGSTNLNDLDTNSTFNINDIAINEFLSRVYSTNKIPIEGSIMEALRTYPVNNFYDMPNHKGDIIALRGSTKILYIQQRFSLFITQTKDRLFTQGENVFLGTSNLFETIPTEVVRDDKGYLGCTSQFACILFKGGYITVDQIQGKIFIVGEGKQEISAGGKRNYFEENWDIGFDITDDETGEELRVDNPFVSVGHIIGYDDKYNRLLITKRQYKLKDGVVGVTREGQFYVLDATGDYLEYTNTIYFDNFSRTWSYSLDDNVWVCQHDYIPNMLFNNSEGLFSAISTFNGGSKIYKHNDLTTKGLFYGTRYPSYVDLIFNSSLDISKLYQSIMWISDTIKNDTGTEYNKTITHIAVYDNDRCTGLINLKDNEFLLTRTNEGQWNFNDFRDLVIDQTSPIIDEDGSFITSNLNNDKVWFEKSNFIGKFITVRLYIDNVDNNTTYIHSVNVKSIKSIR